MTNDTEHRRKTRLEYVIEWRKRHPGIQRTYYHRKHFGLEPADTQRILDEQENKCLDCRTEFSAELPYQPFRADPAEVPVLLCLKCKLKRAKAPKASGSTEAPEVSSIP